MQGDSTQSEPTCSLRRFGKTAPTKRCGRLLPKAAMAWFVVLSASLSGGYGQIEPGGETFWTAGTGNWLDGDNWSRGYPLAASTPVIDNGGTAQLSNTEIFLGGPQVLLGHTDSTSSGTLQVLNGATFGVQDTVNRDIIVGQKGTGTLFVSGSSLVTGRSIFAGGQTGSSGNITLDNANIHITEELHIGQAGHGTLSVINSGEIISRQGVIGFAAGGTGVATITSGVWNSGLGMFVGAFGTGTLNIPVGGTVLSDNAFLGRHTGGNGTANVNGGTWNTVGNFEVGAESTGALNISNGSAVTAAWGLVGNSTASSGSVNIADGSWNISNVLYIGVQGEGSVTLTNGALLTAAGGVELGSSSGASGTLNLNGGVLSTTVISKGVGDAALNLDGGTIQIPSSVLSSFLFFGFNPGEITLSGTGGTIEVQGSALTETTNFLSGNGSLTKTGSGTLRLAGASTFTGGTTVSQGLLEIGNSNALGTGEISVGSAELRATSDLTLSGDVGSGIQLVSVQKDQTGIISAANGQTLTLAPLDFLFVAGSTLQIGSSSAAGTVVFAPSGAIAIPVDAAVAVEYGTLRGGNNLLEGVTAIAGSTSVAAGATLDFDNNLAAAGGIYNLQGAGSVDTGDLSGRTLQVDRGNFSGTISGAGSLQKIGGGTLVLSGNNSFTGGTTISSGTLVVNGDIGDVIVAAGGSLGGNGSVGALTLDGGSLMPGNSPGTLSASQLFWSDGTIQLELGSTPPTSDFIQVSGQLFGDGGPYLFDFVEDSTVVGGTYDLIQFGTSSIDISDFAISPDSRFVGVFAYSGNVLQFNVIAVPEPSSLALLIGGAAAFVLIRRQRKGSSAGR